MYNKILVPIDNSELSWEAVSAAVSIGKAFSSSVTCLHVYAAKLHEKSFAKLEPSLPHQYQEMGHMAAQREFHSDLIDKGLRAISESYISRAEKEVLGAGLEYQGKTLEGKNFKVIVEEARDHSHQLIILGARGLGEVKHSLLGSVCHRVLNHTHADALVLKGAAGFSAGGELLAAVDGSAHSFAGLSKALDLAYMLDMKVSALSVYDPQFHYKVFDSLVEVLSKEAQSIFPMEQQEKLHTAVIDQGLKNVAASYLEQAKKMGAQRGIPVDTYLLEGKPFDAILEFMAAKRPSLLVTGKHGTHYSELSNIGSNTENLLLLAPVNQLVVARIPPDMPASF